MTVIRIGLFIRYCRVYLRWYCSYWICSLGNYQRRSRQQLHAKSALSKDFTKYALFAVIVLGAIYLLNDYRGIPFPVLVLAVLQS